MSKREKLFLFLCSGEEKTTLQIANKINTVCGATMAADLRKKGCHIISRLTGKSKSGARMYGYTLLSFKNGTFGVGIDAERFEVRA